MIDFLIINENKNNIYFFYIYLYYIMPICNLDILELKNAKKLPINKLI